MNISEQKLQLTKAILNSESPALITHIKAIVDSYKTDLWDELSDYQKLCVSQAKAQLKKGQGIPHKEVMKNYKKWLSK
jgi:hypothetical protein